MPPSPITALTRKSTWERSTILVRPCLCIWERRTSSFPSLRKLRSRRPLPASLTRRSTAIRVSITPSLGIMGRTTMPPGQRSPTGGQANFYIDNFGEFRSSRFGPLERFRLRAGRRFFRDEKCSRERSEQSRTDAVYFMQLDQGAVVRNEMGRDAPRILRLLIGKLSTCRIPKLG